MAIVRTFQWRRNTVSSVTGSSTIDGATASSYTTVVDDVGKYLFCRDFATNSKGQSFNDTNIVGPIAAAGETYSAAPGFIEPIELNPIIEKPVPRRVIRREEQASLDNEIGAHNTLHSIAHAMTSQTAAVASGRWSDPATWSNGVPVAGMTVQIGAAFTIIYDVESSAQLGIIMCHGKLFFDETKDTRLVCDTLHSAPASHVRIGSWQNGTPMLRSTTEGKARCLIEFVGMAPGLQANNPGVTASGTSLSLGMMTMGKVEICGEEVTEKVNAASNLVVGQTVIPIAVGFDISKWRKQDWITVLGRNVTGFGTDPENAGPLEYYRRPNANATHITAGADQFKKDQSELVRIVDIDYVARTVTIDRALTYSHTARTTTRTLPVAPHALSAAYGFTQGQTVTIPVSILHMSRSVRFRSAGNLRKTDGKINLQTRAHAMFMASDQVDVRWLECQDMARTQVDPTLTVPYPAPFTHPASTHENNTFFRLYKDAACTQDIADPNNVIGRYAIHFHGPGVNGAAPTFARNMMRLIGASCYATRGAPPQPGWVITHHACNLAIDRCNVYNFRGSGFAWENGQEIGQCTNSTAAGGLGDGFTPSWDGRQRETPNHNGHGGIAFESQARNIIFRNCEAVGCRIGFLFESQEAFEYGPVRGVDPASLRLRNPLLGGTAMTGDRDSHGLAQAQITDLHGCIGVDLQVMFRADHRVDILRQDNTPFIALGWRTYGVSRIMNVENYSYNYFFRDFAYMGGQGGDVSFQGTRSAQFGWRNGVIEGFNKFAADGRHNHGPGWIDIATDMVQAPEDFSGAIKTSASMPDVTPTFTMKTPNDPDMAFNLYGDNSSWGGQPAPLFRGTFADGFSPGGRPWPFWQEDTAEAPESGGGFNTMQASFGMTSHWAVQLNGCYEKTPGNWVMPAIYGTIDWKTFDPVWFTVEFSLVGTWPAGFRETWDVGGVPDAPVWPLPPEDLNKPFPVLATPTNTSAPFIGGRAYVGGLIECVPGEWSGEVDYFDYEWFRGVTPIGTSLRGYVPVAADVGQQITCSVKAYNSNSVSAPVVTAAFTVRPAYTGPTPDTIFGANLFEFWDADDHDSRFDGYNPGTAYEPGTQMNSQEQVIGWAGNKKLVNFGTFGSTMIALNNGFGPDKSRCISSEPLRGRQKGRYWTNVGSGNDPLHLWIVVQRPDIDQTDFQAPIVVAFDHATWLSNEGGQNVIGNSSSAQTLTMPKGQAGVVYHGRDSSGQVWGYNNTVFAAGNGGISNGNREVNLGYNSIFLRYKAVYAVNANGLTTQQRLDMHNYLKWKYGTA